MTDTALSTKRQFDYVTQMTSLRVGPIPAFNGFPSWIICPAQFKEVVPPPFEQNVGNVMVSVLSCPWSLNPFQFLTPLGTDRTSWNSKLYLGEVASLLEHQRLPSTRFKANNLYFIISGERSKSLLLMVTRVNEDEFEIKSFAEIDQNTMVPPSQPLFLPSTTRE